MSLVDKGLSLIRTARRMLAACAEFMAAFGTWWGGQLRASGQEMLAALPWRRRTVLRVEPIELVVECWRGRRMVRDATIQWSGHTADLPAAIACWLAEELDPPRALAIDLAPRFMWLKSRVLPRAVRAQLARVLDLRHEHDWPLRRGELVTTHWLEPPIDVSPDQLEVTLAAIRRQLFDAIVTPLRERHIRVTSLTARAGTGHGRRYVFSAALERAAPYAEPRGLRVVLATSLAALLCAGIVFPFWYQSDERAGIERAQAAVERDARVARMLYREDQAVSEDVAALVATARRATVGQAIAELTQLLPAPIWVQSLTADGVQVRLVAIVPIATDPAKLLVGATALADPKVVSRRNLGVGRSQDRIEIAFTLAERT
ncbi:MAG: hypothetical protein R3F58_01120 [Steroidobacteraceae bacterium]